MSELQELEDEMLQHPDPVVSVPELAEAVEMSDTTVRNNLKLLERDGTVHSKDVGARATAWWHDDRVTGPVIPPEDHPEQSALEEHDDRDDRDDDPDDVEEGPTEWTPETAVDLLDVPGRGEVQDRRQEAIRALLRHLRGGEATAAELRETTYENHDVSYADANSWWKNCAGDALSRLRDEGVVTLVDGHSGRWAWSGDRFL